jgi:predicted nucleotidyltransferase
MPYKVGTIKPINWCIVLTKNQLKLLGPFLANIFKEYGQRELGRLAQEKSNNAVQRAIRQFEKENIVTLRKVGTSKLYRINLDNEVSYHYLSLLSYEGLSKAVLYSIAQLKKQIENYTLFYSLVIFGSYATGKQHTESDLDIALIIPDKKQEQNMKIAENMARTNSLLPLHIQVITFDEMFEMLTNKEENVGKEIARAHRAVQNINIFYKIIRKSLEHGFNY